MQELVVGGRLQQALSKQLDRQYHVRERVRESNRTKHYSPSLCVFFPSGESFFRITSVGGRYVE